MNPFTTNSRIVVTCSNRLSAYLEQEIVAIGYKPVRVFKTGVELLGNMKDCIRLNLQLRCASQVLYSIKEFTAQDAPALYNQLIKIPWELLIPVNGYFSISSNVTNETITNNLFANVKVKDAIADRFREKAGSRPDSGAELTGVVIHLYWKEDKAELFIDSSGETLSKHGYRKIPGKAPMLESLAAATLLATRWDKKSAFINPMCGSGTVAIEAAMLAYNIAPQINRQNFGFMRWENFDKKLWEKVREEAVLGQVVFQHKIYASDIDFKAVNSVGYNLEKAGMEGKAFLDGQLVKGGQMLGDLWFSAWQQAKEDTFLIRQLKERQAGKAGASAPKKSN